MADNWNQQSYNEYENNSQLKPDDKTLSRTHSLKLDMTSNDDLDFYQNFHESDFHK